ncbi:acetylornithine deacetylase [Sesbania bispinosa]|nr:acetylornithine deacetylase [Sesbania bispinosa]
MLGVITIIQILGKEGHSFRNDLGDLRLLGRVIYKEMFYLTGMAKKTSVPRTHSFWAPTDSSRILRGIQHGGQQVQLPPPRRSYHLIVPKGPNSGSRVSCLPNLTWNFYDSESD